MKIGEIRAICEQGAGQERNRAICEQISWIDERMIYDVDRSILNFRRENNPLQNIDEVLSMQAGDGKGAMGSPFYNTWPFGADTDEIFPRFLAVCRGRQKLGGVLNIVLRQSRKIADKYGNDEDTLKTVMVLTDKWDAAEFKKYEKELLRYTLRNGVWYIFLLVTEYGYTQIPFLPNNRNALRRLREENIEDDVTMEDLLMLLDGNPVKYRRTGGTWQPYGDAEYTFDVAGLRWRKESLKEKLRTGQINKRACKRFLESTSWIADIAGDIVPKTRTLDCSSCTLRMYGKSIEWDDGFADGNGDERIIKLQESINRLIEACENEA